MKLPASSICLTFAAFLTSVRAFSLNNTPQTSPPQVPTTCSARTVDEATSRTSSTESSRRSVLLSSASVLLGLTTATSSASATDFRLGDTKTVVGREIQSFNGLIYSFKNTALNGGLDASKIKEPSVPFIEFGQKMKDGEVTFVEFMAPNGEVAYATFKGKEGKEEERLRIGQGYPTGGKNSWSSPDYVIRSVSNFGVPYKFTVPMLANYR